jgi:hypothetical protein
MAKKERAFDHDMNWWGYDSESPFSHETAFEGATIADARAWLWPRFRTGHTSKCPCCGQMVKLYPRTINAAMVGVLARMVRHNGPVTRKQAVALAKGCGDYAKLVFWGMIKPVDEGWVSTQVGHDFLKGARVPKWMLVYDNRVLGCSIRFMDVHEAMGEHFSYEKLMDPETVNAIPATTAL